MIPGRMAVTDGKRRSPTTSVSTGLIEQINEQHRIIAGRKGEALEHAVRCGELLLEAQQRVPRGHWTVWLEENVEMHKTTAFAYMRLARNKEAVQAGNFNGIDPALAALSDGKTLTDTEKDEMRRLYKNGNSGLSLDELATTFGVRKSTVWYWVSAKQRDRVKRLQRHQRDRDRKAAETAIRRQIITRKGGEIARAYSEIRRAQQKIDAEARAQDMDPMRRVRLLEALDALYAAEDKLADAQKLA